MIKLTKIEKEIIVDILKDTIRDDKGYRRATHLENGCEYYKEEITMAQEFENIRQREDGEDFLMIKDVLNQIIDKIEEI